MDVLEKIAEIHDRVFDKARVEKLEEFILLAAVVGFCVHLALIALGQLGAESTIFEVVGDSYFSALYTPFSFILLFEVLAMVLALPGSFSTALGIQFQIVALIYVRRIFGDIGRLGGEVTWEFSNPELWRLGGDMVGALAIFFLTTAFLHASHRINPPDRQPDEIEPFVRLKKFLTLLLAAVLGGLALWSLGESLWRLWQHMYADAPFPRLDFVFYQDMFTVMIFADVFVLLAAYRYSHDFELIFRNCGFVVAAVLLRLAFTAPRPWDVAVSAMAIAFAVCIYLVFGYYLKVRAGAGIDDAAPPVSSSSG